MITSFEVGSVFRIIDEASPALRLILKQVRELNVALDKARGSLTSLGKSVVPAGLTTAVTETGRDSLLRGATSSRLKGQL